VKTAVIQDQQQKLPATLLEVARSYHRRAWVPVPIPFRSKKPCLAGWQKFSVAESDLPKHFNGKPQNVGVLLGKASGDLVDVDLDCPEALAIASYFLPATQAVFGRASTPESHWLYITNCKTQPFVDPIRHKSKDETELRKAMLVEIRSTGAHTVFPGSTHSTGELIDWSREGEPSHVEAETLRRGVAKIAAASLLARYWPVGARHHASLALAGGLLHSGWSEDETSRFIEALCAAANDEEKQARMNNVASSVAKLRAGERIQGWPSLSNILDQSIVLSVQKWLGIRPSEYEPILSEDEPLVSDMRIRRYADLKLRCAELGCDQWLIDGLLQERSLGLLVGDSGLGKSPLLYQMGICVAAPVAFLGRKVKQGPVLILDFENGLGQLREMIDSIARFLGLTGVPNDLLLWNYNDCNPQFGQKGHTALDLIRETNPVLTIIDSISSLYPDIEEKNSAATRAYQLFRQLMRECGTSILASHHVKKPPEHRNDNPPSLEGTNIRRWFRQARGAGALINACDVRLGVDVLSKRSDLCVEGNRREEIALVMGGFVRLRGQISTTYIARVRDETGEPLGYRTVSGPRLLFNQSQEDAFAALTPSFRFKDAQHKYKKGPQATSDFLGKLVALGLIRKLERHYEKIAIPAGASGVSL